MVFHSPPPSPPSPPRPPNPPPPPSPTQTQQQRPMSAKAAGKQPMQSQSQGMGFFVKAKAVRSHGLPQFKWATTNQTNTNPTKKLRKLSINEPTRRLMQQSESDSDPDFPPFPKKSVMLKGKESLAAVADVAAAAAEAEASPLKKKKPIVVGEVSSVKKKSMLGEVSPVKKKSMVAAEVSPVKKKKSMAVAAPPPPPPPPAAAAAADGGEKSKILIRLRQKKKSSTHKNNSNTKIIINNSNEKNDNSDNSNKNNSDEVEEEEETGVDNALLEEEEEAEEEFLVKTWNLRPRKPRKANMKGTNGSNAGVGAGAGAGKNGGDAVPPGINKSWAAAGGGKANAATSRASADKKGDIWPKFSLTLTKEEIEEDLLIMTGAKPSRKPKRRSKNVQKHLDIVSPGMWLESITPDSYKIDPPLKV